MPNNDQHQSSTPRNNFPQHEKQVLDSITHALSGLRYGSIEIVVHEGKVTQIERKEKIRF